MWRHKTLTKRVQCGWKTLMVRRSIRMAVCHSALSWRCLQSGSNLVFRSRSFHSLRKNPWGRGCSGTAAPKSRRLKLSQPYWPSVKWRLRLGLDCGVELNYGTVLGEKFWLSFLGILVISHSTNYKGNGYNLSAQRFLGSFGWTSVSYDWSMVFKATINQS